MEKIIAFFKDFFIVFSLSLLIFSGYVYYKLPTNASVSVPGHLIPVTELIDDLEQSNLYAPSVQTVLINKRIDFVKFMWKQKQFYSQFTYHKFDSNDALLNYYKVKHEAAITNEKKAIHSIVDFSFDQYDDVVDELLEPFSWYEHYQGDSATLLMMLSLIGMHENKQWMNSQQKIVITASLDKNGNILPVGGVALKGIVAMKNQADIFIVAKSQQDEAAKYINKRASLEIIGLETIDEVIEYLDANVQ